MDHQPFFQEKLHALKIRLVTWNSGVDVLNEIISLTLEKDFEGFDTMLFITCGESVLNRTQFATSNFESGSKMWEFGNIRKSVFLCLPLK